MGEAIGAASAWDLAVLSHFFGGLLGFYHGARIFESEGIRVDDLGGHAGDHCASYRRDRAERRENDSGQEISVTRKAPSKYRGKEWSWS
jgi:hypothetical protein